MITLERCHGRVPLKVVLFKQSECKELTEVLKENGVSEAVSKEVASDFASSKICGTAFTMRGLIFVKVTGDVYVDGVTLFHEIGHVMSYHCGFDAKSELYANVMAGLIAEDVKHDIWRELRRVKGLLFPRVMQSNYGDDVKVAAMPICLCEYPCGFPVCELCGGIRPVQN